MDYKAKLILPKRWIDTINGYLNAKEESEFQDRNEVIAHSVTFPDGMVMDIKCCGAEDEPSWTEAVLFAPSNGGLCEVAVTEVADEYLGEWTLELDGNTYTVVVDGSPEVSEAALTPLSPAGLSGWAAC